ncbi:alkaline phosphatase family protein [Halorubrum lacusprofundi]|jgi:predicted AlkP superfamily phosphohydrolase/phosphomutase|uniref:Type I phosphodiesterase/nucleotide pyrophosphatase n=1 Tax=Halorubrum lacusprofundi (strain ATCC 49239 / DSM 5036 / JCM 8891 / ACAM 34) TaxID=416348 RepID=B9LMB6_HALLT|nr:alkaline phosphatase family protein [Halorubrum lacusprofundi]ACM56504.1 type I phosphodiesterase/nucleotide pyrophosphatase [Halorubrum lacusprofundi ATCC 49239]
MGLFDRLRGNDTPRVAFIGIDGLPHRLVADNPDTFPTLSTIADKGDGGPIDSVVPPESSACWPALTSGVNPGETGVYGFQDREVGSYDTYVPMGRDVQATRVWDRVTEAGLNATVMNVPVTFPPQRTVQRMVSGYLSPDVDKAAHPEELRKYLTESDYRLSVNAKLGHRKDKAEFIEQARQTLDARAEAFSRYVEMDDWDLFVGVFSTPDRINHFLWGDYEDGGPYREDMLAFYAALDEHIGNIRKALPNDVRLVVGSTHGFARLRYDVYCNEWLEREGWLSYEGGDDHGSLSDIAGDARAYSLVPGRFYLNVEGREPDGVVPESEYEAVREELRAELEAWEGPNGNPVAKRVVERETVFRGDHDAIAPDLVVIPHEGFDLKSGFRPHDAVFDPDGPRTGMHTFEDAALFIDHPDAKVEDADLLDVAPTLLRLLDVDYGRTDLDGASLI